MRQPEPEQPVFQYPGACDLVCRKKLLLEATKGETSPSVKELMKKSFYPRQGIIDMYIDICVDTCIDACIDMCVDT